MKRVVLVLLALFVTHCATTGGDSQQSSTPIKTGKKSYRFGVVLPLSGKYKLYGESTLHGIECAVGITPPCISPMNVELVVKDSKGDPELAVIAVEELAKDQVLVILGPLMTKEIDAAAQKAQELQIPLISLSQKDGVTAAGDYVFRVGLNTISQVQTLADYAVKNRNLKKVGVIYPRSAYGEVFRSNFNTAVTNAGGQIVTEKSYGEEVVNVVDATAQQDAPIKRSGIGTDGTYAPGAAGNKNTSITNADGSTSPRPRVPTISGVDAIFIPDSYYAVSALIKYAPANAFKNVVLLGNNRWNQPDLIEASIDQTEGAIFVDGFFSQSQDVGVQQFVDTFRQAYQLAPTILEAQAYDATRIAIRGVEMGGRKPASMRAALAKIKNFKGVTGNMTFDANRDAQKRLVVLTISSGKIIEMGKH